MELVLLTALGVGGALADVENYDERNWGEDSFAFALELCIDAVIEINRCEKASQERK